VADWCSH